jgi:acyl-coenzyme A synthetase/AMP-(fatty) acid ligase/acyl carrier protein
VMQATPATWQMLLEAGWQGTPQFKALVGGEALGSSLAKLLLDRTEQLWNMYGPTETTVWSTCWQVVNPELGISIGHPIANTQIHVLTHEQQPCPIGMAGELYIGGLGVATGYWQRPQLTQERFVDNPFSAGEKLYRTGDFVRWRHHGQLEQLGRMDHQIKLRGHRIEPGEIEAALGTHPSVKSSAVMLRAHPHSNEPCLVAHLETHGPQWKSSELRDHLRHTLPEYMVPTFFVHLADMPRLPNGKINRSALPLFEAINAEQASLQRDIIAPQTPHERAIAQVWAKLLGQNDISTQDNFFNLGGHSLLAMRAVRDIEKTTGLQIDPRRLIFETLAQLAAGRTDSETIDSVVAHRTTSA